MTRDERRIARKCATSFVGLGDLYARSGLTQPRFMAALRSMLARGALVDGFSAERITGYTYKVRR